MLEIGKAIDVGIKRKGRPNQDNLIVINESKDGGHPTLLVVADGMGGHAGGEIASQIVIEEMASHYKQNTSGESSEKALLASILHAHQVMRKHGEKSPNLVQMGSTVVAAILEPGICTIGNVGDSRAFVVNKQSIRQVSFDHSVVEEQVRQGLITEEQARNHPKKSHLTMSITPRRKTIEPFIDRMRIDEDDIIVLCSDGLWGVVSEAQIKAVVYQLDSQTAADKLVDLANVNQGPDNISVIIARQKPYSKAEAIDETLEDTNPGL